MDVSIQDLPILYTKSNRAKRLILRADHANHQIKVVIPRFVSIKKAEEFAKLHHDWIEKQLAQFATHTKLDIGATIPILGKDRLITHKEGKKRHIELNQDTLIIQGNLSLAPYRIRQFLKTHIRNIITVLVNEKTDKINMSYNRISIRDTSTRWGSCSANKNLSFSWRLIFAPQEILDYVVCHEVAHLKVLNHSPTFWQVVESICPNYQEYRHWLRQNSTLLHSYK